MTATEDATADAQGQNGRSIEMQRATSQIAPPVTEENTEIGVKEGGYGWVVVACVFLINAHAWGLLASFAVFLAFYVNSGIFPHIGPIALAFVGGLGWGVALLAAPLATVSVGKFGTKPTLAAGILIQSLAFVAASYGDKVWHLLLSQGIAFGIGLGIVFNTVIGLVPQWFKKRRSFANAIGASGTGFGGLVYSIGGNAMLKNLGLPNSFRILAGISFVVNTVCCLLLRDRNKAIGSVHLAFSKDLFKSTDFQLLLAWGFFSMIGYTILLYSLPDFGHSIGLTSTQGSIVGAMFSLSQGVGRPVVGLTSDWLGPINVASAVTLIASLATLFIWIFAAKSLAGAIVFALFGTFTGNLFGMIGPVTVEVIGIKLLPSGLSNTWLVFAFPSLFAEPITLSIKKPGKDGYQGVQLLTGFVFLASFIFITILRARKLHSRNKRQPQEEMSPMSALYRHLTYKI